MVLALQRSVYVYFVSLAWRARPRPAIGALLGRYTGGGSFDHVTESHLTVALYAAVAELYATFTRLPDHPIMPAFKPALPGLLTGWMSILKGHLQVSLFLYASSAPRLS